MTPALGSHRSALAVHIVAIAVLLAWVSQQSFAAPAPSVRTGTGGHLLPAGYLSVKGSQFIDSHGQPVRIASVGWNGVDHLDEAPDALDTGSYQSNMRAMVRVGFNCFRMSWTDAGLHSKNVCRGINYKVNPDLVGLTQMQVVDKIIAYARLVGLKVILDHHSDEGMYDAPQQGNGLWFDLGPGTNGTDSRDAKGDVGTVTAEQFQADWVTVAKKYAGNDTVIGFDLDNEPHNAGNNGQLNWGKGGPCDIHAMFVSVGNAIEAVDPGALIICEGPILNFDHRSPLCWMMDLSGVKTDPVVLDVPHKVVYSVHEYPNLPLANDSGPAYIWRLNTAWGWLIKRNIAPVWIGEMGESMDLAHDNVTIARQIAWGNTLLSYMDGTAPTGPRFKGDQQPVSGDWWAWGDLRGDVPDGCLDKTGNLRPGQAVYIKQMLYRPK